MCHFLAVLCLGLILLFLNASSWSISISKLKVVTVSGSGAFALALMSASILSTLLLDDLTIAMNFEYLLYPGALHIMPQLFLSSNFILRHSFESCHTSSMYLWPTLQYVPDGLGSVDSNAEEIGVGNFD